MPYKLPDGNEIECPCVACLVNAGYHDTQWPLTDEKRIWWMVVCAKCGDKRCPHAQDHSNVCKSKITEVQQESVMGVNQRPDVNYHMPSAPPAPPLSTQQRNGNRPPVTAQSVLSQQDQGDPIVSGIVGAATDNCILGALAGGDILGAVIGDLLNDGELF